MSFPHVRNIMTRDTYDFLRRYINFIDNDNKRKKGNGNYNPMFKVSYVLNKLRKMLVKSWDDGQ